ncbi:hypothetical protein HYC85_009849 [Camellia sinensis]|uniref:Potassium transporter n=1 Tax=Camellia sinensis TaxID=4442 RepID=A0A7J7HH45_CAMSI|nr:hypothetical protein HYC85_009849 [Camellia sinensis]
MGFRHYIGKSSVLVAELWALYIVLQLASDKGLRAIVAEIDFLEVVQMSENLGAMEEERIEEISVRLVGRTGGGDGSASAQWVDGSEVDSESPLWSLFDENESRESRDGYGSVRRRLVKKLKRVDSFDVEAMEIGSFQDYHAKDPSLWQTVALAFQTLSVVYGDMGTNPLYVFTDVFSKVPIKSDVDLLGALSLVMYTISLLPLAEYVFVVLKANDNGEGMFSLLQKLIFLSHLVLPLGNHGFLGFFMKLIFILANNIFI